MKYLIELDAVSKANRHLVGEKTWNLARLRQSGAKVPDAVALSCNAYLDQVKASGLDMYILGEFRRKKLQDVRWEELWDSSLRFKNAFLRMGLTREFEDSFLEFVSRRFKSRAVAVRSSAPLEDSAGSSFAGLHDSYLNVVSPREILKHVMLVWASLWSVSALLYQREIGLDPFASSMAVLIQEVIVGNASGVAFSISPERSDCAMVEAVHGLNQGMVDGTVEPDRWQIIRDDLQVASYKPAVSRKKYMIPDAAGVKLTSLPAELRNSSPVADAEAMLIAEEAIRQEDYFGQPRDTEWTRKEKDLYILQSRPITQKIKDSSDQRTYYSNLTAGFDRLQRLYRIIEEKVLPAMENSRRKMEKINPGRLDDAALTKEISRRRRQLVKFQKAYQDYCIPFGHGMRFFGEIYNHKLQPEDPYEFVDLLRPEKMLSLKRNKMLQVLSQNPDVFAANRSAFLNDRLLDAASFTFERNFSDIREIPESFFKLLKRLRTANDKKASSSRSLEAAYYKAFAADEQAFARELLKLGRASYRLRDDDNIYLDGVEEQLNLVLKEANHRLEQQKVRDGYEDKLKAEINKPLPRIVSPEIVGQNTVCDESGVKFRQLVGQPAGKGIAAGKARVIDKFDNLFSFQKGEILVCDSIGPEMTFVVPLAAGIVERRGGMLIHGAIIAREYGLPCVTGVPKAASKIKNGDHLTVDGYLGIITFN
ncbi:PEP/pyruvate-binding domain-containing protein [Lentisphaerota bacterium ZTH]|nr:hypothetical protein JYG24_00850 [Lentisphaerota bacterium]WET05314.1 PEP/pyruvate-binding domain-containing protein [Lentisphaerota bacterium ZTH]